MSRRFSYGSTAWLRRRCASAGDERTPGFWHNPDLPSRSGCCRVV